MIARPVETEEGHRPTIVEIFFDLVLVFALTRIVTFMGQPPTPLAMAQGILLLLGFWFCWSTLTWLANQVRADVGLIRTGMLIGMLAVLLAALVIPDAWKQQGGLDAPLILALSYIALRAVHLALYFYATAGNQTVQKTLTAFGASTVIAWVPLLLGALLGGVWQTMLWIVAFLVDYGGARLSSVVRQWVLRSPRHFAERHGLILIIAIGELVASIGVGAGQAVTRRPVLAAAALALAVAVCLWWLYFVASAPVATRALEAGSTERRGQLAGDAYTLGHIPLITGVTFVALGIQQDVAHVARGTGQQPGAHPLAWTSIVALYGGVIVFLAGRVLFVHTTTGRLARTQVLAVGVGLLLVPVARSLPPLAALGLAAAFLIAVVGVERFGGGLRLGRAH